MLFECSLDILSSFADTTTVSRSIVNCYACDAVVTSAVGFSDNFLLTTYSVVHLFTSVLLETVTRDFHLSSVAGFHIFSLTHSVM